MATEEGLLKETIFIHLPGVPEAVTMSWIAMGIIVVFGLLGVAALKRAPSGVQNMVEFAIEWMVGKTREFMGKNGPKFLPLFFTLFLFIFVSNLLGLLPGFKSPTSNISVNLGLALIVFFATHFFGIKEKGIIGYFKHFMGPPYWLAPLFFIIHIIGELVRPISLTLRLFFNILAKEVLLTLLASLFFAFLSLEMPRVIQGLLLTGDFFLRPAIILLGSLVSFIQALVFTVLAMIYIGSAIAHEEHEA
ncbi:MAG: F0F1 ATP synthase subunit A [Candidatus Firestonebacteria bacterium]|nr:F0F1 ATP synthase subunit A [Candidatus Firestonebacteria bacterium]